MTWCDPRGWGRRLLAGMAVLACAVLCLATLAATDSGPAQPSFVTRSGAKLMLNGQVFRFSGANIYWGGLDDDSRDALNYPTEFRVNNALQTVVDMGGRVVRCQSCGISTGTPLSVEPSLGKFNAAALRHIDYFIAEAGKYGIRLDIPLVDSYSFYIGGYRNFTDWLGLSSPRDCPSAACASQFYDNPRAIKAFEQYIWELLNHVNIYTGVPNKDNPTIMSWETGNEMPYGRGGPAEFTKWTAKISAYLKSIAPNQLVMDGAAYMDAGDLKLPDVDIESPHFYPLYDPELTDNAAQTAAAGKALVVGEYQWNSGAGLTPFLSIIASNASISGDLYWDLMPLDDDFGFVEHYDGYQLHFPGDNTDVARGILQPMDEAASDAPLVAQLRSHAYAMAGEAVPPPYAVPGPPVITNVERVASDTAGSGNMVEWQGAVGAASYLVRRSVSGATGPWTVVGSVPAATQPPWLDAGGPAGPNVWYQVTAVNPAGVAGRNSAVFRMQDLTLDDNAANLSLAYSHSPSVAVDTRARSWYSGDGARIAFWGVVPTAYVAWRAGGPVQVVEALAYYDSLSTGRFRFLLSANGVRWISVPPTDVQADQLMVGMSIDRVRYLYTIDDVQQLLPGARYVMMQRGGDADGTAEVGEVRLTYGPPG
jgi:mannan endo-1,4-beta-mannosidase